MARILLLCLYVALGVAAAIWLANRPGEVTIEWLGWRLENAPVGIVMLAVLLLMAVAALLYRLWRFVYKSPTSVSRYLQDSKRRRGYKALSQGMVAVAAGDAGEAARLARRADGLLNDPPLTLLLSAQAAQLNGDEKAAKRYFETMLEDPDTRFLGLRGLVMQAIKEGDQTAALDYLRQARNLRPNTPWVQTTLFELSERSGDYNEAERALKVAQKVGALAAPEGKDRRASLLLAQALSAAEEGRLDAALKKAREARRLRRGWLPGALVLARLARDAGREREATKVIEQAWAETPHPDLAALFRSLRPQAGPLEQVKRLGKLTAVNAGHAESRLALAEAALEAELWGNARRHLEPLAADDPGRRACRLMARLEEAEHGDGEAARKWLERSLAAPPEPGWVCSACGARHGDWSVDCGACEAFDTLDWRRPPAPKAAMSDEVLQLDVEADAAEQAQPLTVVAAGASMEPAPGETKRPA
jgi:HemY protein